MTTRPPSPEMLDVGQVVKPHGLRGDVIVQLFTNRLERLAPGTVLGAANTPTGLLEVLESRPHQGRFLVRFSDVTTIEAAEALRGTTLSAQPIEDPEAMFVHDLLGCEVEDAAGVKHGLVIAVEANPASDLLVLDGGALVPLRFVVEHRPGVLVVDVPDGLFT